jgi:malonate transporter and related proteins
MFSLTLTILIPVLFVLLLGYFAWRAKAFNAEQVTGINELALDFALPASLFVGIVAIPRTQLVQDASFVVAVLVDLVGLYLVSLVIGMRLLRLPTTAAALFALGASFPAAPFFGPAVLGGLFGASSDVAIAATAIIANLVLVPLTVVVLEASPRSRRPNLKAVPVAVAAGGISASDNEAPDNDSGWAETKTVIRNSLVHAAKQPYVWAPVVALVLVLTGIHPPSLLTSMLKLIGQATSGVSLFVGGLLLAAYTVRLNRAVALNVALKSVIQPALLIALMVLLGLPRTLAREGMVAAALPSAVIAPMLAARYKTYEAEAGSTMLLTTVLMMIVVPVSMLLVA